MPRGRHRHSPPLHRLLPPSAIAGVSLVCALGPWVFTQPAALRVLAAAAAATAIVGAVVMRHWDVQAGKQVADLTRARAGDEWRFEERIAEVESDLEESRELRVKLEQRLRAKRAELAGLRNEHAALLRRYATAETERASALEGRRLLEIEAAPSPALPAARGPQDAEPTETVESSGAHQPSGASKASKASDSGASGEAGESGETSESGEEKAQTSAVFSPEGSKLFLRAQAALARLDADGVKASGEELAEDEDAAEGLTKGSAVDGPARVTSAEAAQEDEAQGKPEAVDEHARAAAPSPAGEDDETPGGEQSEETPANDASSDGTPSTDAPSTDRTSKRTLHEDDPADDAASDEAASDGEAAFDEARRAPVRAEAADAPAADGARTARPEPPLDPDPDPGPGPGRGAA
ncbi:hypothetical protein, partial [Streptomyces sp. IBSBF 2806]|uniref:hypothetical protein n=1 Tax=Streptomyces sp. IBSBF 2806 TaxID=2903529 RepID=UPI003FA6F9E6